MAVGTSGGRGRRRRWAELRGEEQAAVLLALLTLVLAVLYAVFTAFYLSKPAPGCDETSWTDGPLRTLTILGPLAAVGGIASGVRAAVRPPRVVGLAAIVVNLGMIVVGCALLVVSLQHASFDFCLMG